jgi:hypothetical protein
MLGTFEHDAIPVDPFLQGGYVLTEVQRPGRRRRKVADLPVEHEGAVVRDIGSGPSVGSIYKPWYCQVCGQPCVRLGGLNCRKFAKVQCRCNKGSQNLLNLAILD